jgi:hypothetical protein
MTPREAAMHDEPNRDREQPVEAERDGVTGTEPLAGALLPVGGPGNDPDADKLGDDEEPVDDRGPNEREADDATARDARDRMIPAAGAGSATAPHLEAATLLGEKVEGEEEPDYPDDVRE